MNLRTSAVTLAATLALAACGGGGDDAAEEAVTPTAPATVAQPTEVEQTEPPAPQKEPKTRTYRVKEGDSLSVIAQRFNTTVKDLVRLNDIDDKHHIREGQKLKVPAGG